MTFFESSPYSAELNVDEAYLNFASNESYDYLGVYSLSKDCIQCPFSLVTKLNGSSKSIRVSTKHGSLFRLYKNADQMYSAPTDNNDSLVCEADAELGEFGVYELVINNDNCTLNVREEPVNVHLPLLVTVCGLLLLYLIIKLLFTLGRKLCTSSNKVENVTNEEESWSQSNGIKSSKRISSIDTFRGFALCFMIFINDGGGQYWFFAHSTWNGLYPADVVFPWFLWIMGVCIALSQKTLGKRSTSTFVLIKNIIQRGSILFVLGLSLNTLGIGPVDLNEIRVPGVLQRIAICYAVVSLISVLVWKVQVKLFSTFNYLTIILPQWIIHISILYAHFYLTFYLPVPGCPTGYLGTGGKQENNKYRNCTGGSAGYIDRLLLGEEHLWANAPLRRVYETTIPFDPENILGCLTSIFETFLGMQTGFILSQQIEPQRKIRHLLMWSLFLTSCGLILHHFQVIPLNKSLWSLSFVFTTSGLAFLVFAAFYYLIDYAHLWNGSPFIYSGMNSVLIYVGHEVCFQLFPWHWMLQTDSGRGRMNTHFLNLIENTWGVILWMVISYVLFKKRVFVNV